MNKQLINDKCQDLELRELIARSLKYTDCVDSDGATFLTVGIEDMCEREFMIGYVFDAMLNNIMIEIGTWFFSQKVNNYHDLKEAAGGDKSLINQSVYAAVTFFYGCKFDEAISTIVNILSEFGYTFQSKVEVKMNLMDETKDTRSYFRKRYDRLDDTTAYRKHAQMTVLLLLKRFIKMVQILAEQEGYPIFTTVIKENRISYDIFGDLDFMDFFADYVSLSDKVYTGTQYLYYELILMFMTRLFDSDFKIEDHLVYLEQLHIDARRMDNDTSCSVHRNYMLEIYLDEYPDRIQFIRQKLEILKREPETRGLYRAIIRWCRKGLMLDSQDESLLATFHEYLERIG